MSASKNELSAENITFFTACRENTGRSILDSGDAYGRHYEQPELPEDCPEVTWEDPKHGPVLSTPHYLNERFDIDRDLQKRFEEYANQEENSDLSWFEAGERFCDNVLGLCQRGRDNTYNRENDLSQVFVWEVWDNDENSDWIYGGKSTVTVIYMHTGCDVRGGYGRPIFCRPRSDYSAPTDPCCEFCIMAVENPGKNQELECNALHERWSTGYSTCPYYTMQDDIEEWLDRKSNYPDGHWAKLKSGETVLIAASMPYS